MENYLSGVLMAVMLLVGLLAGAALFSTETEVEVPGEVVYEDKIVEVEVPGEEVIVEVPAPSLLDLAVEDFMKAVEDEEADENVLKCEFAGHEYDFDELSISKLYEEHQILIEDEENYAIEFTVKMKYKESGEESEKAKYDVTVTYEEDEDVDVHVEIHD